MSKYGFPDLWFVADGNDLTGYMTGLAPDTELLVEDDTVAGQQWMNYASVGVKKWTATQELYYDDAALASDAAINGMTSARVLMYGTEGLTVGKHFVGCRGSFNAHYKRLPKRHELHKASVDWLGSGQSEEGVLLYPKTTVSGSSGNGTAVDNGASSANGGAGYLMVPALTLGGYDDLLVKIQHSTDNSTWADLITFTVVTTSPIALAVVTVAGTVREYLRATYAFEGAGTAQSATILCGFARG